MVRRRRKKLTRTTKRHLATAAREAWNCVLPVISGHAHQLDNEYMKSRAMQESRRNNYQPDCPLAHDLIKKLAVIVGQCDLLVEKTPEDSPLFKQALLVRDLAKAVGSELGQLQCDLARLRTTNGLDSKTSVA